MIDSWLKIFLSGFQPEMVYGVNFHPRALPGALLLKPFRLTLLKNLYQSSEKYLVKSTPLCVLQTNLTL